MTLSKHSVRLTWDNKRMELENRPCSIRELEHVVPCPVYESDTLFDGGSGNRCSRQAKLCNRLILGDNLAVLELLLKENYEGKFDLIYVDPPFLSDNNYHSKIVVKGGGKKQLLERPVFQDAGEKRVESYLNKLYTGLYLMKKLLSDKGSIFVHLDWHASHYVKLLLDEVFSPGNFINEIAWCYGGGSGTRRHFHRKHDLILWYAKTGKYIFNPQYRPYSRGTVQRGLTKVKGDKYCLNEKGAIMQDWWTDIKKILSPTARENLKFPTQKPSALIKRLVNTASDAGSLVGDFYAGSGTTAQVCSEMGRKWIICDNSRIAVQTSLRRLIENSEWAFKLEEIKESGDEIARIPDNKLFLKQPVLRRYGKQSCILNLGIEYYVPSSDKIGLLDKGFAFSSLIDFWEIDLNYSSEVFVSELQVIRKNSRFDESIRLNIAVHVPLRPLYSIAVKIYDVFGDVALNSTVVEP